MSTYDHARAAIQAAEANWRIARDIWWEALHDPDSDMTAASALYDKASDACIATLKAVETMSPDGPLHILLLQQPYSPEAEL